MGANVQVTLTGVGGITGALDSNQGPFVLNTIGVDGSNTIKSQRSLTNGASWLDVTTYNSEQSGTVITPGANEQYRFVCVTLQQWKQITVQASRENVYVPPTGNTYLGMVAGQARMPIQAGGPVQQLNRSRHYCRDNVTFLQLAWPNFFMGASETGSGGTLTISASIEYPVGTLTQVKWSGAASHVIPNNTTGPLSDPVLVNIPKDAVFFVQSYVVATVATMCTAPATNRGADFANGEKSRDAASGLADQTMALHGTWSGGSQHGDYLFSPCLIVSNTNKPSMLLIGDSLSESIVDTYNGISGDTCILARPFGPYFAYLRCCKQGLKQTDFISSSAKMVAFAQYFTHVICELAVNDTQIATALFCKGSMETIIAKFPGKKFFPTTCTNKTTSSDLWATVAGQTRTVTSPVNDAYNDFVRAGLVGAAGYIEFNDGMSTGRNTGIFLADGRVVADAAISSGTPTLTSATANFTAADTGRSCVVVGAGVASANLQQTMTFVNSTTVTLGGNASTTVSGAAAWIRIIGYSGDGIHGTQIAYEKLRTDGVVNPALFTYP